MATPENEEPKSETRDGSLLGKGIFGLAELTGRMSYQDRLQRIRRIIEESKREVDERNAEAPDTAKKEETK